MKNINESDFEEEIVTEEEVVIDEEPEVIDELLYNDDDDNYQTKSALDQLTYDIKDIPPLTLEQEVKYGFDLLEVRDLNTIKYNNILERYEFNIPTLIASINELDNYKEIINNIINSLDNYKHTGDIEVINILKKYILLREKLNSKLNIEELEKLINTNKYVIVNQDELLDEINKYITYKIAYSQFTLCNIRLILSVISGYKYKTTLETNDFLSEAVIGMSKAINKYDVTKGFKFSTYATSWIRQAIHRYIAKNQKTIRIPENEYRRVKAVQKILETNPTISNEEICKELGISDEQLKTIILVINQKTVSFETPIGDDENTTLEEFIPSENYNPEEETFKVILKREIKVIDYFLTERERYVLKLRLGLDELNGNYYSLKEVAAKLNISTERARQIEAKAYMKLRRAAKSSNKVRALKAFLH